MCLDLKVELDYLDKIKELEADVIQERMMRVRDAASHNDLEIENQRLKELLGDAMKCAHNGYEKGDPMLCPQCREAIQKALEDK